MNRFPPHNRFLGFFKLKLAVALESPPACDQIFIVVHAEVREAEQTLGRQKLGRVLFRLFDSRQVGWLLIVLGLVVSKNLGVKHVL